MLNDAAGHHDFSPLSRLPGPHISIVVPVYNEVDNVDRLLVEITAALQPTGLDFEIVAVNDGSNDGTFEKLEAAIPQYPQLRVFHFRRNYGQAAAFDQGLREARGHLIATMDADLQNDPRDIPAMISKILEGFDLVSGWRKNRLDGLFLRKIPSRIANWLIRRVTRTKIRDLGCSLKIYRAYVAKEIRLYGEMHRFIGPLAEMSGARVGEHIVNHRPRTAGTSKYGLSRTVKVMLDLITIYFMRNFQTKPIYFFGGVGVGLNLLSALVLLWVAYDKLILGVLVHRNPLFLIAILFCMIGVQFLALGVLAEILIRIYFESQNKVSYLFTRGGDRVTF